MWLGKDSVVVSFPELHQVSGVRRNMWICDLHEIRFEQIAVVRRNWIVNTEALNETFLGFQFLKTISC